MSQENVEIVRHAFEAFNEGDFSVFLNLYDEDIVLHISPPSIESGSFYGARAVERQYRRFFAPFGETYRVEIEELIVAVESGKRRVATFRRACDKRLRELDTALAAYDPALHCNLQRLQLAGG